jgi:hypothetical protein
LLKPFLNGNGKDVLIVNYNKYPSTNKESGECAPLEDVEVGRCEEEEEGEAAIVNHLGGEPGVWRRWFAT